MGRFAESFHRRLARGWWDKRVSSIFRKNPFPSFILCTFSVGLISSFTSTRLERWLMCGFPKSMALPTLKWKIRSEYPSFIFYIFLLFLQNCPESCKRVEWIFHVWRHCYGRKPLPFFYILLSFKVEMAKRDDQKRRERELDLQMRWGEKKETNYRHNRADRDRDRSRSRSEERTPGLYEPWTKHQTKHLGNSLSLIFFETGANGVKDHYSVQVRKLWTFYWQPHGCSEICEHTWIVIVEHHNFLYCEASHYFQISKLIKFFKFCLLGYLLHTFLEELERRKRTGQGGQRWQREKEQKLERWKWKRQAEREEASANCEGWFWILVQSGCTWGE